MYRFRQLTIAAQPRQERRHNVMNCFDKSSTIKLANTADGNIVEDLSMAPVTVSAQATSGARDKCQMSKESVKWTPLVHVTEAVFQDTVRDTA